ncbi:hypothetical protein GQ55_3G403000 [Panicum hallii var. hallii]|uniref:Uncharacterized protein n=1 Tax=Panicum hallii var. hallii TaxID=1504633 RepID=A0A2T7EGX3_9POAL|nr:hypothetical protein GQ55_3G403000 [Panicum hallii var. hallii]
MYMPSTRSSMQFRIQNSLLLLLSPIAIFCINHMRVAWHTMHLPWEVSGLKSKKILFTSRTSNSQMPG